MRECGVLSTIIIISAILVLFIIGGFLLDFSTPRQFPTPMFIGGFVLLVVDAFIVVMCIIYLCLLLKRHGA